mmetsp:Transcript_9239/g.27816  ORF Transcript_9239/g.27816 Transcript_9239/m.27816 type:complete len:139 (+) Transcript_9239:204-620(+)
MSVSAVDIGYWFAVFFATAWLLFCMVYTLILFADLTVDHINPIELCDQVNQLRWPEYVGHFGLTSLLLLRGYFLPAALNSPLLIYNLFLIYNQKHCLDNTTIFVDLPREKRLVEMKLLFFLVMFFICLFLLLRHLASS